MNDEKLFQTEKFLINLRYFSKLLDKKFTNCLKNNGVDVSEFIYLTLLKREKSGLPMVELTRLSKVDKSMTTKVVKKLEKKGYVYRDRDNVNIRNYKICLTPIGFEKASQIEDMLLEHRQRFEQKFTREERKLLIDACNCVLSRCIENKD